MSSFEEKINELQAEVDRLDLQFVSDDKTKTYLFIGAIATPFVLSGLLYLTNPKFIKTNGESDRKKIVKWAAIASLVIWLGLYLYATMHKR